MDKEFNRPMNLKNIFYYNNDVNKQLEQEVGDWLRANAYANPKVYSNDLRHQYASAIYARNLGDKITRMLGNLNEVFDAGASGRNDTEIDKYNNNLGIQYGLKYPNVSKQELLRTMFNDYNTNKQNRIRELGY